MTPLLGLVVVLGRPAAKPLDMVPQVLGDVGVPTQVVGQTQDVAAVVDTAEYMCGSKEMDDYFNEHSGGSVGSIVSQCCDEDSPGYQQCGVYQTACIAAHVASGECKTEDDCDAGCRFFNAVQASCCPHVKKEGTMRLAAQQEQKRIPDGIQLCETESNQAFFDNICGEGSVRAIARDCCGAIGSNVDRCEALKIKCTDEQIFMQVQDSCCPRPFSPPPPSADLGICSSEDARGTERLAFKKPDAA
jgi:hypothetical protein